MYRTVIIIHQFFGQSILVGIEDTDCFCLSKKPYSIDERNGYILPRRLLTDNIIFFFSDIILARVGVDTRRNHLTSITSFK